jgi:hypothetical protein
MRSIPAGLSDAPFRGSAAVGAGLLTRRQLAGPGWQRLYADVYLRSGVSADHFIRCEAAALLLPPGAAIAGRSAAHLFGVHLIPFGEGPVEVAVPGATSLRPREGLVIRRTGLAADEITMFGPLPVTTPLRTALDLARQRDLVAAVVGVDAMLTRRLVTLETLSGYATGRRGLRDLSRVHGALALADDVLRHPDRIVTQVRVAVRDRCRDSETAR